MLVRILGSSTPGGNPLNVETTGSPMLTCTKIIDVDALTLCGSDDRVQVTKDGFLSCRNHRIEIANSQLAKGDKTMLLANTPTTIYIVVTPNGTLKIGRSNNLYVRLQDLHRDDFGGRLTVIATFQGTYTDEAELHERFAQYKVKLAMGEQYLDVQEIREFAALIGIDSVGADAIRRYAKYIPTRAPTVNPDYQLPVLDVDALTQEEIDEILESL